VVLWYMLLKAEAVEQRLLRHRALARLATIDQTNMASLHNASRA
jgi:hypothetical protein